jgi:predicted metal-dependent phosphoesterase TrpH
MRLRLDLHIHTTTSGDSSVKLEDATRRVKEQGLDGFAVTDHDFLAEIPEDLHEKSDLIVIPGMEISANGAHVLAFDIHKPIPMKLPIPETVNKIHAQGGIAVIAHPYSVFKTWVDSTGIERSDFDCVEVINAHQFPFGYTLKKNRELAEKLGLPQTGGSDAHTLRTIGRAYTIFDSESRDVEGVLDALREGRTQAEGRGVSLAERLKLVKE